jgi:hypothetical protein
MICNPTEIAGIHIPCDDPIFLALLAFHIPFGMACVVTGIVAMLSEKRPGRHPTWGTAYYWCLLAVFMSACALSALRWAEDYYLFFLGSLSFAAAWFGRTAHQRRWHGWVRLHITGMGLSYILLLTAFYVDNGKSLPLWQELPPIAFWLLPSVIGLPLIIYALLRHPLVWRPKRATQDIP